MSPTGYQTGAYSCPAGHLRVQKNQQLADHPRHHHAAADLDPDHETSSSTASRRLAALVAVRFALSAARFASPAARFVPPAVRFALILAGTPMSACPLAPAGQPAPEAPGRCRLQSPKRSRRRSSCVYAAADGCSWTGPSRAGYQIPLVIPAAGMGADPGAMAPQADSALNSCFHFLLHDRALNLARRPDELCSSGKRNLPHTRDWVSCERQIRSRTAVDFW